MKMQKNIMVTGSGNRPMLTDIFYVENGKQKPVIIYLHGFNGFKDWGNFDLIAKHFAAAGFVFVKFNLSHGGTTAHDPEAFEDLEAYGNNNYTKELNDLQAIIGWVKQGADGRDMEVDAERIGLIGHSRGGGIVLIKAAEEPLVKAVATWASVAECKTPWGNWDDERIKAWQRTGVEYYINGRTKQKMPLYYQLYEDYINNKERLDIESAVKSLKIPLLICHGTSDPAVPVEKAHRLKEWQPGAALFLVDSDHVFGRKHPWEDTKLPPEMQAVVDQSLQFFIEKL